MTDEDKDDGGVIRVSTGDKLILEGVLSWYYYDELMIGEYTLTSEVWANYTDFGGARYRVTIERIESD